MDNRNYSVAKKKVKKKKGFYQHLITYTIINTFMFLLVFFSETGSDRFGWLVPMMGWGFGLMMHYLGVFGLPGRDRILSKDWEEREILREMNKMDDQLESRRWREERKIDRLEPEDELELKEFKKLREEWDDSELV